MPKVVVTVAGDKVGELDATAGGVTVAVMAQGKHSEDLPVAGAQALPNALEALKLLTEWSKWCAAIATGAIAASGGLLSLGGASHWAICLVCGALGFFLLSVYAAAMLLLAAPAIAQRLPPSPPKDVFHMRMWEGIRGWPVYVYTWAQSMGFFLGLACFVAAVVIRLLGA